MERLAFARHSEQELRRWISLVYTNLTKWMALSYLFIWVKSRPYVGSLCALTLLIITAIDTSVVNCLLLLTSGAFIHGWDLTWLDLTCFLLCSNLPNQSSARYTLKKMLISYNTLVLHECLCFPTFFFVLNSNYIILLSQLHMLINLAFHDVPGILCHA